MPATPAPHPPPLDRLPLLQAHCAVWPHTVMAVVYAPISSARRFTCVDEVATPDQLRRGSSWLAMLGLGGGRCQYSGWSLERLRARVRDMQKRAEETGGWVRRPRLRRGGDPLTGWGGAGWCAGNRAAHVCRVHGMGCARCSFAAGLTPAWPCSRLAPPGFLQACATSRPSCGPRR